MTGHSTLRPITVFGLGHLRPAPGTWGSLPAVAIAALLMSLGVGPSANQWVYSGVMLSIAAIFTVICAVQGDQAEARFNRKDPPDVVADEMAGQAVALLTLPPAAVATPTLAVFSLIYAFVAFRVFDIVKVWPCRQIQETPGGWGIVLDDLIAGFYALITLHIAVWLVFAP
jgi:phosphatidylglycerophosphatase A